MSVLKEGTYTVPSRVIGVCKYLLQVRNQRENRDKLYQILSPETLLARRDKTASSASSSKREDATKTSRQMIKTVVRECINMGLLVEDGEDVAINPILNLKSIKQLPTVISNLYLSSENAENHDFAKVLAWYLAQDFYNAPGNWQSAEPLLRQQVGSDLLELNDIRYGQFDDWICYLGFGWQFALSKNSSITVPDPTTYLRENLKYVFAGKANEQISVADFIDRLGEYCPVFETGYFRDQIEQQIPRDQNVLSTITSMALCRLVDEGVLKFERLSDSSVPLFILLDGTEEIRVTHVNWIL
ncbi:protein DpdG [Leptolyngbya sp. GGD]|uniref:protein DpdG n=1 Tax=Leptolyngbya sp. GGD TaxID=2997907 RepID=UPI00227D082E|nr:protein DpdG [Leptolyngbya sp. GGD]MCY6493402.1 protein DpdG [Leptolyngbya sp. GGD]